jgi:hypothetical protein
VTVDPALAAIPISNAQKVATVASHLLIEFEGEPPVEVR